MEFVALKYLLLLLVALFVTLALVPFVKKLAFRLDAVDHPSARRVNKRPIARLGGAAMMGGLAASLLVYVVGVYVFGWTNDFLTWRNDGQVNVVGVGLGVLFVFGVGVADDVCDLRPRYKLLGQVVAACIVVASGLLFSGFHNPLLGGYIEFGWLAYPITVFYLVAFANVINLIDGLDGLAAGITSISAITLFVLSVVTGANAAAMLSIILLGACLGFLYFNYNPASIFMGDSGALTLGFFLGIISLFGSARTAMLVSLLVPVIAAGVPIIDTTIAIIRRRRAGRPISEADRGHIHHRLLDSGYSQKATVFIMWGWTAVLSVCALLMMEFDGPIRFVAFVVVFAVTLFGIWKLNLLKPVLGHAYTHRGKRQQRMRERAKRQKQTTEYIDGRRD